MRLFGEFESRLLSYLIKPNSVAVDVGANHGAYTYLLSQICKTVISFEPNKSLAKRLLDADLSNVKVMPYGLSNRSSECDLYLEEVDGLLETGTASINGQTNRGKSKSIRIKIITLDSLNLTQVDFIKIDVEGHELEAINGAVQTIKKHKPIMLIEIEERHISRGIWEVINTILRLGYCGFFFYDKTLHSISDFNVNIHQNQDRLRDRFRYCNNFLFFPCSKGS
jgi:FkbM family methyltransferase